MTRKDVGHTHGHQTPTPWIRLLHEAVSAELPGPPGAGSCVRALGLEHGLCLMPCVLCACHADPRRQAVSAALTQAVRVSCPASLGLGPSAGEGSCNRVGGLRFLGRGERALQFGQGLHLGRRARPSPGPCRPLLPRHMQRLLARLFAKHPSAASARATQGPEALAKLELVLTGRSRRIHRTDRQTMADRQRDRYIRYA